MAIRHTIPAGLPTGTLTGKVAGDDYRADHLHVPFEIALLLANGNTPHSAQGASLTANTEIMATSKLTRNLVDLSQARQVRLVAMVLTNNATATATIKLQYVARASESATWAGADVGATAGQPNVVIGAGTVGLTRDSGWQAMAAGAQIDNAIICCTVGVAWGATVPTFGSITAFFR